tara:strand:- start:3565 stop:3759 length:195 start_codon:yes stop_codon:yes gene_type:complete
MYDFHVLDTSQEYLCKNCGSNEIGFDALVDVNNKVIRGPFDNYICCNCDEELPDLVCKSTGEII